LNYFLRHFTILNFLAFLIPFELLFSYACSGFLKPYFGEFYKIFLLGNILLFIILFFTRFARYKYSKNLIAPFLFFLFVGFFEVLVTILNNSFIIESILQFTLGFLSPTIIILYLSKKENNVIKSFFYFFYLGYIIILLLGFILIYIYYDSYPVWFREAPFSAQIFLFRYLIDDKDNLVNPLMILLGNFNKASNYLIFMNLFSLILLDKNRHRNLIILFWVISTIALIILFSRLTLLLYPFVFFISGFYKYIKSKLTLYQLRIFGIFIFSLFIFNFSSFIPSVNYLLYSKINDDSDANAFGTGLSRVDQWSNIWSKYTNFENIFGIGHNSYSYIEYGYLHGGSHNLFIDHYLASGIISPLILISVLVLLFMKGVYKRSLINYFAVLIFIFLAFREYTFAYLNASMQGGFFFCILIFVSSMNLRLFKK
jgi:hypothetical protein